MAAPVNFNPVEGNALKCAYAHCDKQSDAFVSHTGEGMKHPFHLHCAVDGVYNKNTCPSCERPASLESLFSDAVLGQETSVKEMPEVEDLGPTVKGLQTQLERTTEELLEAHKQNESLHKDVSELTHRKDALERQAKDDASNIGRLTQRTVDAENNLHDALTQQTTQTTPPVAPSTTTQTVVVSNQGNQATAVYSSLITTAVLIAAYVVAQFL